MARIKSPAKRAAIFEAAVHRIAKEGLAAPTAKIAREAGLASGTLFTYFSTKEELLNELYLELKREVYGRINARFPQAQSLEQRARHVWSGFLEWAIEFPEKRKVSMLLNVSDSITAETRAQATAARGLVEVTMQELGGRSASRGLPPEFASSLMAAVQETTMDFVSRHPRRRKELVEQAFQVFWRALR